MSVVTIRSALERVDLHLREIDIESKSEELNPILNCDTLRLAIFELQEQLDDLDPSTSFAASEPKPADSTRGKTIKITKRVPDGGEEDSRTAMTLSLHVQLISDNPSVPVSASPESGSHICSTVALPAIARPRIGASVRLKDIAINFEQGCDQHLDAQGLSLLVALEKPGNDGCEYPTLRMVSKESAKCDDYLQISATAEDVV
ncbi:hypothetical protein EST38_g14148 [Candolleomyces aberdarensis]|uniref:Uncharacterized protein n=1 Tax=Candolleomyces aberdarensis TaxID=2316362 RepID=A0A4Q2CY17_9AGAR|nr:hypothetical protein EST38_g14148 [Candolleomyces aberdarensis]